MTTAAAKAKTATRIYVVTIKSAIGGGADIKRLVRASSQAQAINHTIDSTYSAAPASQDDLVELLPDVGVEDCE